MGKGDGDGYFPFYALSQDKMTSEDHSRRAFFHLLSDL